MSAEHRNDPDNKEKLQKWINRADNYLDFLLNNEDSDLFMAAVMRLKLMYFKFPFNTHKMQKNFERFVDKVSPFLSNNDYAEKLDLYMDETFLPKWIESNPDIIPQ